MEDRQRGSGPAERLGDPCRPAGVRAGAAAPFAVPWKNRVLIEHARAGDLESREELRWLHRPKLIRLVRSLFPRGAGWRRAARDLADQLLSRGLAELEEWEPRDSDCLWPFLRARSRHALRWVRGLGEGASPEAGRLESPPSTAGGSAQERELERDAFDRWLRLTAGERRSRAVLLRLDLGLELADVARECGFGSPAEARSALVEALSATIRAMAGHRPRDPRRWVVERRIAALVDDPDPRGIDELLASRHLQPTRDAWIEETGWSAVPLLLSRRFGELIRGVFHPAAGA